MTGRLLSAAGLVIILTCAVSAQQSGEHTAGVQGDRAAEPRKSDGQIRTSQSPRAAHVELLKGFVDRALVFQNLRIRVLVCTRLADLLWADDPAYARGVFLKALNFIQSAKSGDPKEREINGLRKQVITLLSQHDPALARQYAGDSDAAEGQTANPSATILSALDLVKTNPVQALDAANKSLEQGFTSGMVFFLKELRRTNEPAADQLFLQTLNRIKSASHVDGNDFLFLGTYLFTSPKLKSDAGASAGDIQAVAQVGVGNILVFDITEDRPRVPPALVRAYLTAAEKLLMSPPQDPKQKQLYYALAYLLLPKAQKFAPGMTASIYVAMQRLAAEVLPDLARPDSFANLSNSPPKSVDEKLTDIDKLPTEEARNARYLLLIYNLLGRGDYENARRAAGKVTETDARDRLETMIDFGEAAKSLKDGKTPRPMPRN